MIQPVTSWANTAISINGQWTLEMTAYIHVRWELNFYLLVCWLCRDWWILERDKRERQQRTEISTKNWPVDLYTYVGMLKVDEGKSMAKKGEILREYIYMYTTIRQKKKYRTRKGNESWESNEAGKQSYTSKETRDTSTRPEIQVGDRQEGRGSTVHR